MDHCLRPLTVMNFVFCDFLALDSLLLKPLLLSTILLPPLFVLLPYHCCCILTDSVKNLPQSGSLLAGLMQSDVIVNAEFICRNPT